VTQTCQSGVELLMDYLEGQIAPDVRAAVERHVADCPRCIAFVESYRRTPDIFKQATAATLPPDLARTLVEAVRRQFRQDDEP
jgi:anti-sigma factor RsiW